MISIDPHDNSFYMRLHQRNRPVCGNNGAGRRDNCSLLSFFYVICSGNVFMPHFINSKLYQNILSSLHRFQDFQQMYLQ